MKFEEEKKCKEIEEIKSKKEIVEEKLIKGNKREIKIEDNGEMKGGLIKEKEEEKRNVIRILVVEWSGRDGDEMSGEEEGKREKKVKWMNKGCEKN